MPILRGRLGKVPSGPKARVRNFIANKELGTQSDIHENVLSPGVILPWHFHVTEEVIVVLEGRGECSTEEGTEEYSAGDVIDFASPRETLSKKFGRQTFTSDLYLSRRSCHTIPRGRPSGPNGRCF